MDFEPGAEISALRDRVREFQDENINPVEASLHASLDREVGPGVPYPADIVAIREKAQAEGLWNLFLPDAEYGAGLSNLDYSPLCEVMGRSPYGARAFNCQAPDTGTPTGPLNRVRLCSTDRFTSSMLPRERIPA